MLFHGPHWLTTLWNLNVSDSSLHLCLGKNTSDCSWESVPAQCTLQVTVLVICSITHILLFLFIDALFPFHSAVYSQQLVEEGRTNT